MPMHPLRRQRLLIVLFIVVGASIAAALVFWALRDNMNFFYSPVQIERGEAPTGRTIRVGGLVLPGSVQRSASGLEVQFRVSDNQAVLDIVYEGILPDLFAEGQGAVVEGFWRQAFRFDANLIMAKHSEDYMPVEMKRSGKEMPKEDLLKTLKQ